MVDNQISEVKLSDIIKDGIEDNNNGKFKVEDGKFKAQQLQKEDSESVYKFLTQINNI